MAGGEINEENPLQCKELTELRKADKNGFLGLQAEERGLIWLKGWSFWILTVYYRRKGLQMW